VPGFRPKSKNSWAPAAARSHQSFTDGSGELHHLKIVARFYHVDVRIAVTMLCVERGNPAALWLLVLHPVLFGKHSVMENAYNQDAAAFLAIKEDVPAMFEASQPGANVIAGSAQSRIPGQLPAARLKLPDIAGGLGLAPGAESIVPDIEQVSLRPPRKTKRGHG
jgi:hypothetical protein